LWGWHALRRSQAEDSSQAATFWWLALFSFVPTAVAFSASWVLPYSVWNMGPHIIVAVPYLMLVAVAVQRLRPRWVRSAIVLLMVGWAALAGFTERSGAHGRGWNIMVNQMIRAEPSQKGGIMVYDFGDGWVLQIIRYYLEQANEGRFQVAAVRKTIDVQPDHSWVVQVAAVKNIADVREDRFWVVAMDCESTKQQLGRFLADGGYQVGEGLKDGRGSQACLLPVWRHLPYKP
ncbi:MAG: hypothetical protein H0T92_13060, partial [Pyrinomonadaceae bacterium]|nr:hypothetical protein [Pyrinomonadaceae bacterium]